METSRSTPSGRPGIFPRPWSTTWPCSDGTPRDDRETFELGEFVEAFDLSRVANSNAKFDRDKLLAFNTDASEAMLRDHPNRLRRRFADFLQRTDSPLPSGDDDLLDQILQACRGFRTFEDVPKKCGVLFADDASYEFVPKAVKKVLLKNEGAGLTVLSAVAQSLDAVEFTPPSLEAWMADYCETNDLSMGQIAQPLRVAVTGTTVSPGIIETLLFLGREKTLARIARCLEVCST